MLRAVFDEIFVPPAVRNEVVAEGAGRPGATEVLGSPWILRMTLSSDMPARALRTALDPGEADAIALAVQLGRSMPVLLDDRKGRRLAREHGVTVVGSAGLLIVAKDRGILSSVQPLLNDLLNAGLYLSDAAVHELLAAAGERSPTSRRQPPGKS